MKRSRAFNLHKMVRESRNSIPRKFFSKVLDVVLRHIVLRRSPSLAIATFALIAYFDRSRNIEHKSHRSADINLISNEDKGRYRIYIESISKKWIKRTRNSVDFKESISTKKDDLTYKRMCKNGTLFSKYIMFS